MNKKTRTRFYLGLRPSLAIVALAMGIAQAASTVRAELLFSDSFDYPIGLLDGNGPPPDSPPGQGPWVRLGRMPRVTSPGLEFPGIDFTGNAVTLGDDGATGDTASATIMPVGVGGSGVAWVGFLISGFDTFGYAIVTFNDGFGATAPQLGVLYASLGRFGVDNAVVPTERNLTAIQAFARVTWVVAKLDFNAGKEFLFVNPLGRSEPAENDARAHLPMTPEFQASGFDRIVLKEGYASRNKAFKVDEVRVGTTFADLTP